MNPLSRTWSLPAVGVLALIGLIAAYAIFNGLLLIGIGVGFHNLTRTLRAT